MDTLVFDEKYLAGGSEHDSAKLLHTGTISLEGREDLRSFYVFYGGTPYRADIPLDGQHYLVSGPMQSPCNALEMDIWRSGPSEFSYKIMLTDAYDYENRSDDIGQIESSFTFVASFGTGAELSQELPFLIITDSYYNNTVPSEHLTIDSLYVAGAMLPESVAWDFGGRENIYVPGNSADPWRYQSVHVQDITPGYNLFTRWGATRDGDALLRVYEDALPPEALLDLTDLSPHGYGVRNYRTFADFSLSGGMQSFEVFYNDQKYVLNNFNETAINIDGGTIIFDWANDILQCRFELDDNVIHSDPSGIDVFNQKLTLQGVTANGVIKSKDILVQIVDDAPFVRGDATIDLSSVAAWALGGEKIPLSYEHLKDVLYRSVDYNDWADGFKITNCEGKYGATGVFAGDGDPDDPASAAGNAYYMVDPDKIALLAPGEIVTEKLEYSYTDSDGDTANGVLNITLKGMGINPDEAIALTPRPGNVPISGGDVPADNPYVPGNPADPDRDLGSAGAPGYDPMNPNWGLAKDGSALLRVFESGLANGSEAGRRNVTAHGYLDIDAAAGLKSLRATTDGTDNYTFENNVLAIPLDGGTLTFTQNPDDNSVYYEFTLTKPIMHEPGNGINSDEQHVELIVTDNFGNEERIGLEVQIIDDVPAQNDNVPTIRWSAPVYMWPDPSRYGNTGFQFHSADAIEGLDYHNLYPVQGDYGTFELVETSYADDESCVTTLVRYTPDNEKLLYLKNDEFVTETLKYTYTDADGDSVDRNVIIELHGPGIKPHFIFNETDSAGGYVLDLPGFEILDMARDPKYGSVSRDADGIWRYNLSDTNNFGASQGSDTVNLPDEIYLRVKDARGVELNVLTDVDIIDSVPTFTAGPDRLVYDFGADNGVGKSLSVSVGGAVSQLVPGVETMIAGEHGLLTLSPDGACVYAPNSDAAGSDRFDFTIIDSDGDRALATVLASAADGVPQTVITVQDADSLAAAEIGLLWA